MVRTRISSAMTEWGYQDSGAGANAKALVRQYVSEPIPAQTITGTFKGQIRMRQETVDDNYDRLPVVVKVVSNDGSTVRGTLLSLGYYGTTTEFDLVTPENRKIADGDSLSSVAAQADDRIVVEIGVAPSTGSGSFDSFINATFGDDSGTDLAEDETTTSSHNPWIEFSQDLFNQTTTATAVDSSVAAIGAVGVAGLATSTPPAIDCAVIPGSPTSIPGLRVIAAEAVNCAVVAEIPFTEVPVDSYDPMAVTAQPVDLVDAIGTRMAPTSPAGLNDMTDVSGYGTSHIIGPGSGDTVLVGSSLNQAVGVDAGQTISYIIVQADVWVRDDVPAPNVYVAHTAPQFRIKIPSVSAATYGLVSGAVPSAADGRAHWVSDQITAKPGGGVWTWANLNAIEELGVTAHYVLGTDEYTALSLQEVWLEVYGPIGSVPEIITITQAIGRPSRVKVEINVGG